MGYSAKAVANYFLDIAELMGETLSPLKIQKLVYIAHGWHLAFHGEPLVGDEYAEAWHYGPVFPSLYHEFKEFGKGSITGRATELDFEDPDNLDDLDFTTTVPEIPKEDSDTRRLIHRIWEVYGKFTGLRLSDMTHAQGTPWAVTRRETEGRRNADIPDGLIEEHYKAMLKRNRERRRERQDADG